MYSGNLSNKRFLHGKNFGLRVFLWLKKSPLHRDIIPFISNMVRLLEDHYAMIGYGPRGRELSPLLCKVPMKRDLCYGGFEFCGECCLWSADG
mgnify:CR=1 FL=1